MWFCSLTKGITSKICRLCVCVLLNLLCVWILQTARLKTAVHKIVFRGPSTYHRALAALCTDQSSGVAPVCGQTEVAETLVTKTVRVAVLWREEGGGEGLDEGKVGW